MYSGSSQVVYCPSYYFDDSSTSTRCLYLSLSQLWLIKRIGTSYARARTHTCPCAYARARTLVAGESLLGGGIPAGWARGTPVVEVREGAKRPWMRIILTVPASHVGRVKSLVVGRAVASARSTDAGTRTPSSTRRHSTEAGRATPVRPRAPKPSRRDD